MRRAGYTVLLTVAAALSAPRVSTAIGDDPVVVSVGGVALRASDLERRLARLPAYQLRAIGDTPSEARLRFVESVVVPELLYGAVARERHLEAAPQVRERLRETYHRAARAHVRRETLDARPVTDAEIAAYYDAHRGEFQSEKRLLLWRILVDDEALARRILVEARGSGGPDRWRALAREHSRDVATNLRGGLLGFVGSDGHTDVPQVRVEAALYAAADAVKDGELVREPVRESDRYAVIWRRGTRAATTRTLEDSRTAIRDVLERDREKDALDALLERLRAAQMKEHHPELLESLPEERPEALKPSRPAGSATPASSAEPHPSADPTPRPAGSVLR